MEEKGENAVSGNLGAGPQLHKTTAVFLRRHLLCFSSSLVIGLPGHVVVSDTSDELLVNLDRMLDLF